MQIKKKKIIFVVPSLQGGGAEKVAETLLGSMRNSPDLELTLVLFRKRASEYLGQDVTVKNINVRERGSFVYTAFKFIKIVVSLAIIIIHVRPHTIVGFMEYSNIVTIISNWLAGKKSKVVVSVHAPPSCQIVEYGAGYREKIAGLLMKMLYNKADSIVAVSESVRKDLVENFKIHKTLIRVISNPIDLNKIALLSEEKVNEEVFCRTFPIILAVGRLSKEKGHDTLLRAFSLLRLKTQAKLVILGEGKEEKKLKQLGEQLGIEEEVCFIGYKTNPYKYMKRSTLLVHPSLYEGFGIVLVEAMVCGIPVISTRSYEGIENIVEHEKTGLLVKAGDEQAIAESMVRLLNDAAFSQKLSKEAGKKAEEYSVEKIMNQYRAVLDLSF